MDLGVLDKAAKEAVNGLGQKVQLNAWGKTSDEAVKIAHDKLTAELSSMAAHHPGLNAHIMAAMNMAGNDVHALFTLAKKFNAIEEAIARRGIPEQYRHHNHAKQPLVSGGEDAGAAIASNIAPADATPAVASNGVAGPAVG